MRYQNTLLKQFPFAPSALSKEQQKKEVKRLSERMEQLQLQVKENRLPVIVLVEGWGTSGKGGRIAKMISQMDPRFFRVVSTNAPTAEERARPFLYRHIKQIPENGQFLFLDSGWMDQTIREEQAGQLEGDALQKRMEQINIFERQLFDNGYLLVKLFLHISRKEQRQRIEQLQQDPDTAWRVSEHDLWQNDHYERELESFSRYLDANNLPFAPWHIIDSTHRKQSEIDCLNVLCGAIEGALEQKRDNNWPPEHPEPAFNPLDQQFPLLPVEKLSDVALDQQMSRKEYKEQLRRYQQRLSELHNQIYRWKIPVILAYEGWDAAGKGGNIKRIAGALDPRGYEVVPIASPKPYELARHYLWRFWEKLPKAGHIVIFDRTWYGRVMVERLEGFCSERDWKRAYTEINEFERQLTDAGAVLLKFWIQIDKDTQLQRFEQRRDDPDKRWKLSDEDWRNREKWDEYEQAIDQMLQRTNTTYAPWHIIESNCKYYARIKTLRLLTEALEEAIQKAKQTRKEK